MSLGSLARYDDAEDEIRDEDHNLVLAPIKTTTQQEIVQEMEFDPPSTSIDSLPNKPKTALVADYDMSDDDDMSESDPDEAADEPKIEVVANKRHNKESVVNLGLFDRSSVLASGESETSNFNDSYVETFPRSDTVLLPPEPEGRCSKKLQEKIETMLLKKRRDGMNVNEYIEVKKDFRNPSIYEKLIQFIGIDEHGTNFPRKLYDPSIWGPDSHYDELARKQKEYHKEKEKEKLQKRTQVEFVTGTKKPVVTAAAPTSTSTSSDKKSKWDQKVPPQPKNMGGAAKNLPIAPTSNIKNVNKI